MKRFLLLACISALTGCAVQPKYPMNEYASGRLCEIAVRGNFWMTEEQALTEIARRGENCNAHMGVINARINAENANTMQSLELLRQAQPQFRPMSPPQSMRCVSQNVGGSIVTNCN